MLGLDGGRCGDRLGIETAQGNGCFDRDLHRAHGNLFRKRIRFDQRRLFGARQERGHQRDGAEQSENPDVQCALQIPIPDVVRKPV